jgi:hypothetical protein
MEKSFWRLVIVLSAASTIAVWGPACVRAAESKFGAEVSLGGTYEQPVVRTVNKIPLSIRDVPVHPDDAEFAGNAGPIAKDTLRLSDRVSVLHLKGFFRLPIAHDRLAWRTGVGLDFDFRMEAVKDPNKRSDIAERNYENAPGTDTRGEGAALTYIQAGTSYWFHENTFVKPYVFSEVSLNLSSNVSLDFGANLHQEQIFLENGWDRYDNLDTQATYNLENLVVVQPYVGLKCSFGKDEDRWFVRLLAGTSQTISERKTDLGNAVELHRNSFPLLLGLEFGAQFGAKH